MLRGLQEVDGLSSRNLSKNQRAEHRNGIRRCAVKMPRSLSRGVKAWYRPLLTQDFRLFIGGETAECIGDGADQGIGEIWRFRDRSRPIRFRRL